MLPYMHQPYHERHLETNPSGTKAEHETTPQAAAPQHKEAR